MNSMNSMDSVYKLAKYIITGVLLFFAIKYVSQGKTDNKTNAFVAVIAVLIFAVIENVYSIFAKKKSDQPQDNPAKCNSYCAMKEHLENVPAIVEKPATVPHSPPPPPHSRSIDNKTDYEKYRCDQDKIEKRNIDHNPNYETHASIMPRNDDGTYTVNVHKNPQAWSVGNRSTDDVIKNETQYNYEDYNIIPPNVNEGTFESGYSYLPPFVWNRTVANPPICVAEKRCSVCPGLTSGSNPDLKEWNSSRRVMPPDSINVAYITDKLNSGR
jgi:hypothetical protein